MIEVQGVSYDIGGTAILRGIDLSIAKGGVTALVGPNGAGKSTLLSLMARLLPLQKGRILVDGLAVDATPGRVLAKHLSVMRQDALASLRLRVEELVSFGRFPHHRGRPTADDRRLVAEALAQFDLAGIADRFLDTLSGGQRQRAMVAMTFCQGTGYMLLDEPLNNLDMFHARALMRTLRSAADEHGRTIVIVLHDLNHAAAYANAVVVMKDGRVVEHGEPRRVLRPDLLRDTYGYEIGTTDVGGALTILHHR